MNTDTPDTDNLPVTSTKMGRPPKPISKEVVFALAKLGLSAATIAGELGISRRSLFYKFDADPELHQAFESGAAAGITAAAKKLKDAVDKGESWAIMFLLRSR